MKKVLIIILLVGVVLRLVFHFFQPTFNIDEINLGNNIRNLSFLELLYPLDSFQSAPPLYLWIQKLIIVILPFSFWVEIKILSFIASITGVYLFYTLLSKLNAANSITVLLFAIFIFNPFILYNSLTVKQYGLDLVGILILLNFYENQQFKKYNWIYFTIWCLISNIGLFGCAGYLVFSFFNSYNNIRIKSIIDFVKSKLTTFFAPLPYVIYFIWYMQQEGASEMKNFMVAYWSDSFIPLNANIFKYTLYLFHQFWIYFFSAYEFWGFFLMILIFPLLYQIVKRRPFIFKERIYLLAYIILIHVVLNLLHFYPLSDRLFLYLTPFFILLLGASLDVIIRLKYLYRYSFLVIGSITLITILLYFSYLPFKNNDVVKLYEEISYLEQNDSVYLSPRAQEYVDSFNDFTEYQFKNAGTFISFDDDLNKSKYIVTKVHQKVKPNRTSAEENLVQNLINSKRIKKINQVAGYNIYIILTKPSKNL